MNATARSAVLTAAARGAPPRRAVVRAALFGALAQLAGVALVGTAAALLTWSARRPGLAAVAGLLVVVELIAFLRAPLRHAARHAAHDLGLGGLRGWRTWLLDSVATWSPSRLGAARSGDLLARCLEDTDAVQDLWVRVVVPAVSTTGALVAAAVALAAIEPLAGAALAAATLVVALLAWRGAAAVCVLGAEESALRGRAAARAVEFAYGAEALALLGADAAHVNETRTLLRRRQVLRARGEAVATRISFVAVVLSAATLAVAAIAAPLPSADPERFVGVVLAVLACGELLVALPAPLGTLGTVAGAAARLDELAVRSRRGTRPARGGSLVLDRVDVAADAEGPTLLEHVALQVERGAGVSVVGPTGVGKSALLAVAARLEEPRGGAVSLGGDPLEELEEASLRRHLAWLPDRPALLEGRVRDVLDVGRGLDESALTTALDAVGLTETLRDRGGLDATLAKRASDLSGGERRRLAIARVLAGHPDVFVLDEPTAGLDATSATVVLHALERTGAGVLVATHDPRVAAWSGVVHEVRDGTLCELSRSAPPSRAPGSGLPSPRRA